MLSQGNCLDLNAMNKRSLSPQPSGFGEARVIVELDELDQVYYFI